jgi:hypothetical protein
MDHFPFLLGLKGSFANWFERKFIRIRSRSDTGHVVCTCTGISSIQVLVSIVFTSGIVNHFKHYFLNTVHTVLYMYSEAKIIITMFQVYARHTFWILSVLP